MNKKYIFPAILVLLTVTLSAAIISRILNEKERKPDDGLNWKVLSKVNRQLKRVKNPNWDNFPEKGSLFSKIPSQLPESDSTRAIGTDFFPITYSLKEEELNGPVKEFKQYSLFKLQEEIDERTTVDGTDLYLRKILKYNHDGKQIYNSSLSDEYFFNEDGKLVKEDSGESIIHYYYTPDGGRMYGIEYEKSDLELSFKNIFTTSYTYNKNRVEVASKYFKDDGFTEDYSAYSLNGEKIYYAWHSYEESFELLQDYSIINKKTLISKVTHNENFNERVNQVYQYDNEGRVLKWFYLTASVTGALDEKEYFKDKKGYLQKRFILVGDALINPFNTTNKELAFEREVLLDNYDNVISEKVKHFLEKYYKFEYIREYDNYGNCISIKKYKQNLDKDGNPVGEKFIYDFDVYKITYYNDGEKTAPYTPDLNSKREKFNKRIIDYIKDKI